MIDLLDYVNELIAEETLSLPAQILVDETIPEKLPSEDRVSRFHSITERLIANQRTKITT